MKSKEILPEFWDRVCKGFSGHAEARKFLWPYISEMKVRVESAEEEIEEWKGMYEIISKRERGNNDQLLNEFGNYLVKRKANSGKVMSSNFIAEIVEEFLKKKEGN